MQTPEEYEHKIYILRMGLIGMFFVFLIVLGLITLYPKQSGPQSTLDCPTKGNYTSFSNTICGEYQLISPNGLKAVNGSTTIWLGNQGGELHFNASHCAFQIQTSIPSKSNINQYNLTGSVYNQTGEASFVLDEPAYLYNGTSRKLVIFEYDLLCGQNVN